MTAPSVRNRSYLPAVSRKMDFVAPEEIDAAVRYCLGESYGVTTDDLIRATGRALGFERLGDDHRALVDARVADLEARKIVAVSEDRVRPI